MALAGPVGELSRYKKIGRTNSTKGWILATNTRLFCYANFFLVKTSPPPN